MALDMNDFIDLHRLWIVAEYRFDFYIMFNLLEIEVNEESIGIVNELLNCLQLLTGKELCYINLAIC